MNVLQIDFTCGSRIIIVTTANSDDEHWYIEPLLEKQNLNYYAF